MFWEKVSTEHRKARFQEKVRGKNYFKLAKGSTNNYV